MHYSCLLGDLSFHCSPTKNQGACTLLKVSLLCIQHDLPLTPQPGLLLTELTRLSGTDVMVSSCSVADSVRFQRPAIASRARSGVRLLGSASGNLGLSPSSVLLSCFIFLGLDRIEANNLFPPVALYSWQGRGKLLNVLETKQCTRS